MSRGALVSRSQAVAVATDLEQTGLLTPIGLDPRALPDCPIETFIALAAFFDSLIDASQWAIADLLLQAEARFGEAAYQIATATRRSERTLANWVWCASRIPRSRRREELSYTTHAEVAALDPKEQEELLDRAVAEGWTSRQMRHAVTERRVLTEGEEDECEDVVAEGARDIRAHLLACGLNEITIFIEVAGPGVSYSVRIP